MTEQFDPADEHRMYELEQFRSETTMIERPATLPTSSAPGQVAQPAPVANAPQAAAIRTEPAPAETEPVTPETTGTEREADQLCLATIATACIVCLTAFAICFLIVRYAL